MKKYILISSLTILLISIPLFVYFVYIDNEKELDNPPIINDEPEEVWPKEYEFSMLATGDALIHSPLFYKAKQSDGTYDFSYAFTEIEGYFDNYDLNYINQETVFADATPSNYPRFNTPAAWGEELIEHGFNLISLANNHSMDMGSTGAFESATWWEAQEDVYASGMYTSLDARNNIRIEEINGITYSFLSYTEHTNGLPVPSDQSYLANVYDKETVENDINLVRDLVDVIIVAIHWGSEYRATPNDAQIEIANELAAMDVDIVLGNHPHWIQPITKIDDTLVVYSMGNFISDQISIINEYPYTVSVAVGAFVTMDIKKLEYENDTHDIIIDNINVELTYTYKTPDRFYKVIPFSKMTETHNSNYVQIYEDHKERMMSMSDEVTVTPLNAN